MYDGVIQMKRLGTAGRWGNQIMQYMFLRTYAKRNNLEVVTPIWDGTKIYGLKDGLTDTDLFKRLRWIKEKWCYNSSKSCVIGKKNVTVCGNFLYETSWHAPDKDFIRKIFTPLPEYSDPISRQIEKHRNGKPLVGIHIRLGDYKRLKDNKFFISPYGWYHTAIEALGVKSFKLFISTDEHKSVLDKFSNYDSFSWPDKERDCFWDFYTLTRCDYILVANSTFSLSASMLASPRLCMRPNIYKGCFVKYDPWNMSFLQEDNDETKT